MFFVSLVDNTAVNCVTEFIQYRKLRKTFKLDTPSPQKKHTKSLPLIFCIDEQKPPLFLTIFVCLEK